MKSVVKIATHPKQAVAVAWDGVHAEAGVAQLAQHQPHLRLFAERGGHSGRRRR